MSVHALRPLRAAGARIAVTAAVLGLLLLLPLVPAHAGTAYAPAGSPTLSTSTPAPGAPVAVAGDGFRSGSTVRVVMYSDPVVLGTATANAAGEVDLDVTIPASFAPGSKHRIELQGVDPSGEVRILSQPVTLAGSDGSVLAYTGAAVVPLVAVAGALMLAGGALVATGRIGRRRTTA